MHFADDTMQQLVANLCRCSRCALCLQSCPTFRLTGDERESPRGRVFLMKLVVEGSLASQDARRHLDSCLRCRKCEPICPTGVRVTDAVDAFRRTVDPARLPGGSHLVQRVMASLRYATKTISRACKFPALRKRTSA